MNKTNLWVDASIFIGFVVAMNPSLTGITVHEWFSLALAGTLIVHLLLHWKWITTVAIRFFRKLFHTSRLKFLVDVLLFTACTVVMMSGLMISRSIVDVLGINLASNPSWRFLHSTSADAALWLVGLHFALNWKWVVSMVKRHILTPLFSLGRRNNTRPVPVPVDK
jgi:hypothetical protein